MPPPGITPEWPSSDYFDDDADVNGQIQNVEELRFAVQKCVATAARSQAGLTDHARALTAAAARLAQASNNPHLASATGHLENAAQAVEQAQTMLRAAQGDSENYLEGL
ncbi:hypothetical protein ACFQS1_35120 [Paractinoplanes rhizophilus]|uniref:ESX-1 secretion-associated protein n=1 Tax=Paractinoplanes rhizophilus TaxID=1416877 RepID=A0ABW2I304_9ACTN